MKFTRTTPSVNGKYDHLEYEASPQRSGASVIPPQRTTFPADRPPRSVRTLLYDASRYRLGSAPFLRWLLFLLGATAVVWGVGRLPGRWWVASLALLLLGTLLVLFHYWRRRDFVHFVPGTPPTINAAALSPSEKLPVMVTGLFSVEQKYQRFTWLPGFYRTFATREHALLCQVTQRTRRGLGHWPEEEVGLWYIFFSPAAMRQIEWGAVTFGTEPRPAIAVTQRVTIPRQRLRREQTRDETFYIAFATAAVGELIWADLQHDFPHHPSPTA
mgnify:CR=1 FL=1